LALSQDSLVTLNTTKEESLIKDCNNEKIFIYFFNFI